VFLTGIVALIMLRILRKDFARYNEMALTEAIRVYMRVCVCVCVCMFVCQCLSGVCIKVSKVALWQFCRCQAPELTLLRISAPRKSLSKPTVKCVRRLAGSLSMVWGGGGGGVVVLQGVLLCDMGC
jgi:hypothetical protein